MTGLIPDWIRSVVEHHAMSEVDDVRRKQLEHLKLAAESIITAVDASLQADVGATRLSSDNLKEAGDLAWTIVAGLAGSEPLLINEANKGIGRLGAQTNLKKGLFVSVVDRGYTLCRGDRRKLAVYLADTLPSFWNGWGKDWQTEYLDPSERQSDAHRKGSAMRRQLAETFLEALESANRQAKAPGLAYAILQTNRRLAKQLGNPSRTELTNAISELRKRRSSE